MCIFVKGCLTFELEYILFRDVIHVNQTFSVTLLDTMIHLVVNEIDTWPMDYSTIQQ